MSSRSNSANAPNKWNVSRPDWCRRVDAFGEALEADAGDGQVVHGGDQVAQVAPEAVQAPYDEGVARAEVVEDRLELGAVVEGAGRLVRPNPYAAGLLQLRRSVGGPSARWC